MDSGFGGWAAHDTNRLTRAFASAGIGLGSLPTDRQAPKMPNAAVAFDTLQAFQVHADFSAQITFDDVLAVLDGVNDLRELLLGQILGANAGIDIGLRQNIARIGRTDAIDIAQRDVDALVGRNFNADDTSHKLINGLALPLFMPRVGANHADHAFSANNFAIFAKLFNRCANFHILKLR